MSAGNQNMSTVLKRCVHYPRVLRHWVLISLHRLEAITSRLEDVAEMQSTALGIPVSRGPGGNLELEPEPEPIALPTEDAPSVKAFSLDIYTRKVKPFVALTESFAIQPVKDQVRAIWSSLLSRYPHARNI